MSRELYTEAREYIIDSFRVAPNRWWTEGLIIAQADKLSPARLPVKSMRNAIDWHEQRGHLESRINATSEEKEWRLTNDGRDLLGV